MGLGGVVVPGTLRDSLFILDAPLGRDGGPKPETVMTDTASYSDIVFGLFAICCYQFSPRIADISDARLWRTHATADYGPLQDASRHTVRLDRIRSHWGDMLRVAGSLTLGEVRGHDLIRMLSRDGRPTGLGDAFAHYGRIFKTLHLLQFISDDGYRRMIGKQRNITEARHRLARRIFFGQRGELRQNYREGMEDQLGSLGLALNAVVLWNSLYLDRAAQQLAADGFPVTDDLPCEGRARMATALLAALVGPRIARSDASHGMNFTSGKAALGPSSRCPRRCRRCRSKNASG